MGIAAIPQIGERAQTFEDILQSLLPGLLHGTVTHASGHVGDLLMLAVIAQRDDQTKTPQVLSLANWLSRNFTTPVRISAFLPLEKYRCDITTPFSSAPRGR